MPIQFNTKLSSSCGKSQSFWSAKPDGSAAMTFLPYDAGESGQMH
jgi:hypothetical protein